MSFYCEVSGHLVRGLSRSIKSASSGSNSADSFSMATFPPYEGRALQDVKRECSELYNNLFAINEKSGGSPSPALSCSLLLFYTSLQRNKRCGLAYLMGRLSLLKGALWDIGGNSAALLEALKTQQANKSQPGEEGRTFDGDSAGPSGGSGLLSKEEILFLHEYEKILLDFQRDSGIQITTELQPPNALFVEVRVIKGGIGTIQTSSGPVNFELNSTHLMKRQDAELFIRQGILRQTEMEK